MPKRTIIVWRHGGEHDRIHFRAGDGRRRYADKARHPDLYAVLADLLDLPDRVPAPRRRRVRV